MSKTILIVDHSDSMREEISVMLNPFHIRIVQANTGRTGLQQLDNYHVHGIICDIDLPIMDGIEMIRQIKNKPQHRFLPVIMLTASAEKDTILKAKEMGVNAWLIKPCKPEKLSEVVQNVFKIKPAMPKAL